MSVFVAVPVHDLDAARAFYGRVLGCSEGRSSERWVDFDLYGHQFVCHLVDTAQPADACSTNPVDGHDVPVPHYGVVLKRSDWDALAGRLRSADVRFVIEPTVRFAGQTGEQATMFLLDPSGNALEFKSLSDEAQLFAR